jgi:hypothetical protein
VFETSDIYKLILMEEYGIFIQLFL